MSINFIKAIICILLITVLGSNFHNNYERPTKNITIFIHGTLMPFLALLNPLKTYSQTIKSKDWYYKCLQALRSDSDLLNDSIILEEGLKKIDPLLLYQYSKLHANLAKAALPGKGAYQAISAYDTISKFIKNSPKQVDNNAYYTFGFNGILSHSHRKEAGLKFYEELIRLVDECLKSGYRPVLNLCGYSHGGNLILLLAHAELIYKKNLHIDKVILFGTPIQAETAVYANHPMFNIIYNFFSEGDNVQNSDSFSTSSASSYRTFKELSNIHNLEVLSKNIYDIRLLIANDSTILGHFSYWFFNKYSDSWINGHGSAAQSVLNQINPLPIASLAPLFLELIEQYPITGTIDLDINLKAIDQHLEVELINKVTKAPISKIDISSSTLSKIKRFTKSTYSTTEANSNATTFLKNLGTSISTILQNITE